MKKKILITLLSIAMLSAQTVSAKVKDYQSITEQSQKESQPLQQFTIDDGEGNAVQAAAQTDTVYVIAKSEDIRSAPGEKGEKLETVTLDTELSRVAVCENGWSKVQLEQENGKKVMGYIRNAVLNSSPAVKKFTDTVTVAKDSDILDYPGKKDGEPIGEVIQEDEVTRTGTVNKIWSRILYQNEDGTEFTGYIPTNVLRGQEQELAKAEGGKDSGTDKKIGAGTIHESTGEGVFADAIDGVTQVNDGTIAEGVQIGTPVAVSSSASLKPLGTFRITHYCPCSICCGPYTDGITSTGVTATTNHTIAVYPSQIPYGSRVVINGQVYVAEDCGGGIKQNCIDIYVATHDEGETKGVYYTDVYLIVE